MSFQIDKIRYDSTRKLQSGLLNFTRVTGTNSQVATQYMGVPYNIDFSLNIYIRNIDDGLQIIEQIVPFFTPDYTMTMDFVDVMGTTKDIPLVLNDIDMNNTFEGDATTETRHMVWTLTFTMQSYLFGPVNVGGGLIKTATANLISYSRGTGGSQADQSTLQLAVANTPLGHFMPGETVFQGRDLPDANAIGTVINWTQGSNAQLYISITSGNFIANANIHGALSGGSVNVLSVPPFTKLASIVVTPNPPTANIGDDFGFTTVIKETPNI
jgi:hypothetical protein